MLEKRVLSVGIEKKALGRLAAHLEPARYANETAPTARSALALLTEIRFDLVVLAHPQAGLELRRFLTELRRSDSESRTAKVLILAAEPLHPELHGLRERSVEIISSGETLIGDLATKVLSGDRRVPVTVMVRLEADLPYGRSKRICQSENLSLSGMLVRTEDTLPIGTSVLTRFTVPGAAEPIQAQSRVVRLTAAGEVPGIALHFEKITSKDRSRLERFLAAHSS